MAKRKSGLHRKVSSIFDGVAVPGSGKSEPQPLPVQEQESQQSSSAPSELQKSMKPAKKDKAQAKSKPRKQKKYKFSAPAQDAHEQNEKKKIMFMVVLLIFLAFVLIKVFLPGIGKKSETKSEAELTANILQRKLDTTIDWKTPELYPATLRDPMRTGRFRDPITGEWVDEIIARETTGDITQLQNDAEAAGFYGKIIIQSILYSKQGRSVVIGNQILYEGNTVEGATIVKIDMYSVVFSIGGEQFTVSLRK